MTDPETTEPETTTTETAELPPEQETRIVDKVVGKVKEVIKEIVGEPAPDESVEEGVSDGSLPSEPSTPRQQESQMEDLVRGELARIGAMEEQAKINEHVKAEMERPPVAMKKVTQFLWGGGSE
jgi:hypothetical protein